MKNDISACVCVCVCVANGFTMSNVNASGTSDESAVSPNFVTYPVHSNSSAAMEAGFDTSAGTYMQHGSYFWFSRVLKCPVSYLSP